MSDREAPLPSGAITRTLTRNDIIDGLRELIRALRSAGHPAAERIAVARSWPEDWVNDSAAQFVPTGFGREAEWLTIHDDDGVLIQVASPETLLAMKLFAAEKRYLREAEDLVVLLHATGIDTVEQAERLYGEFYPGDEFSIRLAPDLSSREQ